MNKKDISNIYAPVCIPTLCRYKHFKLAIESLMENTWANNTSVYVALDYPSSDKHMDGYKKICKYLERGDFTKFKAFHVIKREKNVGALSNAILLWNMIMTKYDRWIFAEDDIEFSPIFLEYMDICLERFKDDPSVFAINGYSYDIKWKVDSKATVVKQKGTVSEWGIGYWTDKFLAAQNELNNDYLRNHFNAAIKTGIINDMVSGRYCDYVRFAMSGNKGSLYQNVADVSLGIYINLKNMYIITPVVSKTRNHGFDGSGVYCSEINKYSNKNSLEYDYDSQLIDSTTPVIIELDKGVYYKENIKALNDFLFVSRKQKIETAILMAVYGIIGQNNCEHIYQFLKLLRYRNRK